jgi:hypothetical protein
MVWTLQPQIMPPCCIGMAGAGHEVMPPWFDQLLIEEEEDHDEVLDAWLPLLKETAEPLAAAS